VGDKIKNGPQTIEQEKNSHNGQTKNFRCLVSIQAEWLADDRKEVGNEVIETKAAADCEIH